ncbi:MAG: hypothetical protein QOG90_1265 [Actinomycetota bacterium]|jgi:predicted enzyme related to lactoylglutathione lyase
MGTPRPFSVEIHTDDVAGVAAFYRDVIGVSLEPGDDEATHYETYAGEWGGADFFFFAIQPLGAGGVTTGVELGFEVTDLDTTHERIAATGARVIEPPVEKPWGRAATYMDPAGNLVQLNEA